MDLYLQFLEDTHVHAKEFLSIDYVNVDIHFPIVYKREISFLSFLLIWLLEKNINRDMNE